MYDYIVYIICSIIYNVMGFLHGVITLLCLLYNPMLMSKREIYYLDDQSHQTYWLLLGDNKLLLSKHNCINYIQVWTIIMDYWYYLLRFSHGSPPMVPGDSDRISSVLFSPPPPSTTFLPLSARFSLCYLPRLYHSPHLIRNVSYPPPGGRGLHPSPLSLILPPRLLHTVHSLQTSSTVPSRSLPSSVQFPQCLDCIFSSSSPPPQVALNPDRIRP